MGSKKVQVYIVTPNAETIFGQASATRLIRGNLKAVESKLPANTDPILYYSPEALQEKLSDLHDAALARAETAKLREQLTQRTSKESRTSKQSLPPARRVAETVKPTALSQTEADLGLDQDWSNVQGLGHRAR